MTNGTHDRKLGGASSLTGPRRVGSRARGVVSLPPAPSAPGRRGTRFGRSVVVVPPAVVALLVLVALLGVPVGLALACASATAAVSLVLGIRLYRPAVRAPWLVLAGALALQAVSYLTEPAIDLEPRAGAALVHVAGTAPHVAGFLVLATGLVLFARGRPRSPSAVVDGALLGSAAALLVLVLAIEPLVSGPAGGHRVVAGVAGAAGLVLVVAATGFLLSAHLSISPASRRLLSGVVLLVSAEFFTQVAASGGVDAAGRPEVVILSFLAFYLLARVASSPTMRSATVEADPVDGVGTRALAVLVGVAAVVPPGLVLIEVVRGNPVHVVETLVASFVVIGLALHRTALTLGVIRRQSVALARIAETDPVTGLDNRRRFERELASVLVQPGARTALVVADVDRFRQVRDALGDRAADGLIGVLAARFSVASDPSVRSLARISDSTFAVLLAPGREVTGEGARGCLRQASADSVRFGDVVVALRLSIGVIPVVADGQGVDEVLRAADLAVLASQDDDGAEDGGSTALAPQLALELPAAIARDEVTVHFQPQVEIATGAVRGVEALVRWEHPVHGMLAPHAFVPAAERSGLIRLLTEHVLEGSVVQAAAWAADGLDLTVAVNLSVHNLLDPELPSTVARVLERHGLAPERLELEVTETMAMVDPVRSVATLSALHHLGVTLSIDDYGTGYSSLSYLKRLPVDRLKIDRSFVSGIATDPANRAIVRSTIELAAHLGLLTVAEGVEDDDVYRVLRDLGCDEAQGFGLGRPVPARRIPGLVAEIEQRLRSLEGSEPPAGGLPAGAVPTPARAGSRPA